MSEMAGDSRLGLRSPWIKVGIIPKAWGGAGPAGGKNGEPAEALRIVGPGAGQSSKQWWATA